MRNWGREGHQLAGPDAALAKLHGRFHFGRSAVVAQAKRKEPEKNPLLDREGDFRPFIGFTALGLLANPIVFYSLFTKVTTGSGLDPGPYGLAGACEGISYLTVLGFVGASIKSKVDTGSGLPAGPSGLLGAAEGLSFLSFLAAILVFGASAAGLIGA